jgi:aspartate aminotransferase
MSIRLSDTVLNLTESATIKMAQMSRDLKSKGVDVISLSLGEPDFTTPKFILEAAKKALDDGYTHYTPVPGLVEYREAIVQKLKRDNDLSYHVNQIVVSNGAKQTISNIAHALLNPGDEVIIFAPYWVSYFEIVKLAGGVPVVLTSGVEQDYKISPSQLKDSITDKTKFVLYSSPCNPTGSVFTKDELKAFADILANYPDILIVSDEIYEHIVFEGTHQSIAQFPSVKEQTIVVNGMSKGYAMTGWRLGYMAAPLEVAQACDKIQGQVTSGAASFSQKAAAEALKADLAECYKMRDVFKSRRDLLLDLMKDIPHMILNVPNGAFYLFPDVSAAFGKSINGVKVANSDDMAEAILQFAHLGVVSGEAFGNGNCIRISYATSDEQLIEAAKRLKKFFSELK